MRALLRILPLAVLLAVPASASAAAGGGTGGFGGGGGGGGGSFGGGGSGGGGGGSFVSFVIVLLVVAGIGVVALLGYLAKRRRARERTERDTRVSTASAEAAEDDPVFAAEAVKRDAAALFTAVQEAWVDQDGDRLATLLGPDLLEEWRLRLADFHRKGWHNEVRILSGPKVDYVGLVNREGETDDRVTVCVTATLHDVVRAGDVVIKRRDSDDPEVVLIEYWTLARADDAWRLESIEAELEGAHHLTEAIVASPWSDDERISDDALVGLATEDAPPEGFATADVAAVDFEGTAREAALDLALADPRFAPDVLEAVARRAAEAWAHAVDGDDAPLRALASEDAVERLLYDGDADHDTRLVVRGLRLQALAIEAVDGQGDPPRMTVAARMRGRRYVQNRHTTTVQRGSTTRETEFTERWTFALDGDDEAPWRLVASTVAA